jgi:signal transduction histidine kinase
MTALPPDADLQSTHSKRAATASASGEDAWERRANSGLRKGRWIGWRLRALVAAALCGCLALLLLVRALGAVPALDEALYGDDSGVLRLEAPSPPSYAVRSLVDGSGNAFALDTLALHRSPRWLVDDHQRAHQVSQHDRLGTALAAGPVQLILDDGRHVTAQVRPRGSGGLGAMFWLASALAMLLYLVTMVVVLALPNRRNVLYAVMAFAQVGNLLFLAAEAIPGLGWPVGFMRWDHGLRSGLDLAAAAALVHVTGMHPRQLPGGWLRALAVWLLTAALAVAVAGEWLPHSWWWVQGTILVAGTVAIAQLRHMQGVLPHPRAALLWRLCLVVVGTQLLLTLSMAALNPQFANQSQAATIGAAVWVVFAALLLLMLPFLSRTQTLMREFSLLAAVSTVATSLDLLFVAVLSLSNFASLTLALFISLGAYAGLRQWLLNRVMSHERITTERLFEHLYRMAREIQARPQCAGEQLTQLLREMFEPLAVRQLPRHSGRSRVVGDGVNLVVPVPALADGMTPSVVMLAFAQRGRRLFTNDDARLADQVLEQLTRAVAFDAAVERGRSEERMRIAQDLHDDIGARLLTLMYQAPTREMEDYLRHTLKDLKTLTRGLAAPNHRLSHAVAEWKADISQRLAAADCELGWSFTYDRDFELSVVQWSALTRVLRELVSNAIAHAKATHVAIDASLEHDVLALNVIDNGCGRNPQAWSHGLGLGGVRKRVRQLGGDVEWRENGSQGIACRVVIPHFVGAN